MYRIRGDHAYLADKMVSEPSAQRAGLSGAWPCREWPSSGPLAAWHAETALTGSCLLQNSPIKNFLDFVFSDTLQTTKLHMCGASLSWGLQSTVCIAHAIIIKGWAMDFHAFKKGQYANVWVFNTAIN